MRHVNIQKAGGHHSGAPHHSLTRRYTRAIWSALVSLSLTAGCVATSDATEQVTEEKLASVEERKDAIRRAFGLKLGRGHLHEGLTRNELKAHAKKGKGWDPASQQHLTAAVRLASDYLEADGRASVPQTTPNNSSSFVLPKVSGAGKIAAIWCDPARKGVKEPLHPDDCAWEYRVVVPISVSPDNTQTTTLKGYARVNIEINKLSMHQASLALAPRASDSSSTDTTEYNELSTEYARAFAPSDLPNAVAVDAAFKALDKIKKTPETDRHRAPDPGAELLGKEKKSLRFLDVRLVSKDGIELAVDKSGTATLIYLGRISTYSNAAGSKDIRIGTPATP